MWREESHSSPRAMDEGSRHSRAEGEMEKHKVREIQFQEGGAFSINKLPFLEHRKEGKAR